MRYLATVFALLFTVAFVYITFATPPPDVSRAKAMLGAGAGAAVFWAYAMVFNKRRNEPMLQPPMDTTLRDWMGNPLDKMKPPNKSPEPTPTAVTPRADE